MENSYIRSFYSRNISTILLGENVKSLITADDIYRLPGLILSMDRVKGFLLYDMDFGYRNEFAVENYLKKSGNDIYTTGATTLECARMLYKAGAKSVTILPFGVTQYNVTTTIRKPVKDANDDIYQLRLNHVTGEPFWVSKSSNYEEFHQIRNYYFSQ